MAIAGLGGCPVTALGLLLQLGAVIPAIGRPLRVLGAISPSAGSTSNFLLRFYWLFMCGRVVERLNGSGRYLVMLMFGEIVYRLFLLAFGLVISARSVGPVVGMSGWMATVLCSYYMDVPATVRMRYCGVQWSNKAFLYILAAQTWMGGFDGSHQLLVHSLSAFAAALMWRMNVTGVQQWFKCPQSVTQWLKSVSRRFLDGGSDGVSNTATAPTRRPAQPAAGQVAAPQPPPPPQPPVPNEAEMEEMVETLLAMGFDREQAQQALVDSGYRLEVAVGRLVG